MVKTYNCEPIERTMSLTYNKLSSLLPGDCESTSTESGWREAAMRRALNAEAAGGEPVDALLMEIRCGIRGAATLMIWPARLQMMQFIKNLPGGYTPLISGEDCLIERDQIWPYHGWYRVEWNGAPLEVVLSPSTYTEGTVICISADGDSERLSKFNHELEQVGLYPAGRCLKYSRKWTSSPEMDAEIGSVTWDDLILAPEVIAEVRGAVEGFVSQKAAFAALGFPWKRGLLLIGPPGTGKTMLCKAAAAALPDRPFLYVRDLETEDRGSKEDAITQIFRRARKVAPCLLVFEDIDGLVNDANRTVFLNELDGFQNNHGLLIMASSNHPEKIDEALRKRPSRFDRVVHIGMPALRERETYCLRILTSMKDRLE